MIYCIVHGLNALELSDFFLLLALLPVCLRCAVHCVASCITDKLQTILAACNDNNTSTVGLYTTSVTQ